MALEFSDELFEILGGEEQEPDQDIINRLRFDDALDIPIQLTDIELWKNFVNNDLYEMDKKLRSFFKKTRMKRERDGGYKTTAAAMFLWIYGRKATSTDSHACRLLHMLLRYYCTEYTGQNTFNGKRVPHVYKFSRYATKNKRPYSLRLRLEEAENEANVWRANPTRDKRTNRRRQDQPNGGNAATGSGDKVGGVEAEHRVPKI